MPDPTAAQGIKPGIYRATYQDGTRHTVAVVLGPNHRPAMIPIDPPVVVTEIVEHNWTSIVDTLTPLVAQDGLSGAMYWDPGLTITVFHEDITVFTEGATDA